MKNKTVQESDFRKEEFRNAKVEDYEFREDGMLVRKDRWEQAVRTIAGATGHSGRSFELDEVVRSVVKLANDKEEWTQVVDALPFYDMVCTVVLDDNSVLHNVSYQACGPTVAWDWKGSPVPGIVVQWREEEAFN